MTARRTTGLRLGDRVEFNGKIYVLAALNGDVAELRAGQEAPVSILVSKLLTDSTFKLVPVDGSRRRGLGDSKIFEALPDSVKERAYRLEGHITEILDGSPIEAEAGARPRREYDVTARSMRQRLLAKEAELREASEPVSLTTLKRLVRAYESQGVIGLVDQRLIRRTPAAGQVDQRVIDALLAVLHQNIHQSSGSMDRIQREVAQRVRAEHGDGVELPSRATFHRLVKKLAEGRHAAGSALGHVPPAGQEAGRRPPRRRIGPHPTHAGPAARRPVRGSPSRQTGRTDADRFHSPGHCC